MKTFDILYKRTRTGAIQYWKISVGLATYPTIYKEYGQLGTTSPVQHKKEIKEGKYIGKANETKPAEQAVLQAESDWKKKRNEGYKSLPDLDTILGEFDALTDDELEIALESRLPQFKTDANGQVEPMLAKDRAGDKKIKSSLLFWWKLSMLRLQMK